jgi:two-component system response regulator AlgR
VQMPGMTGIEFAQHLLHLHASHHLAKIPAIIFVTAYDEYALKAFEVHAFDYLLKPVRATRLQDTLVRMQQTRNVNHGANLRDALSTMSNERLSFSVTERNRVLLVPVNDVLFLKAELKYVTIQTKNHAYLTEESLVSIEQEMSRYFVRVHRNALVARSTIIGIERASIHDEHEDNSEPKNGEQKQGDTWQVILQDSPERLVISRRQLAVIKALLK